MRLSLVAMCVYLQCDANGACGKTDPARQSQTKRINHQASKRLTPPRQAKRKRGSKKGPPDHTPDRVVGVVARRDERDAHANVEEDDQSPGGPPRDTEDRRQRRTLLARELAEHERRIELDTWGYQPI